MARKDSGAKQRGADIRRRREALGLAQHQLASAAMVGLRTLQQIEDGTGGHTRVARVEYTLDRLEAGDQPGQPQQERAQSRPGVWVTVTVEADDDARVGDVKWVEEQVRRILNPDED